MPFRNIVFLLFLIGFSFPVISCNCVGNRTVQESVNYNDGVISGTVISKSYVTVIDSTILRTFHFDSLMISKASEVLIARYEVVLQETYKGDFSEDTLLIYSGIGTFDCGFRFKVGEKYIIYGKTETYFNQAQNGFHFPKGENTLWTYKCLRTRLYNSEEVQEIKRFLN